MKNSFSPNATKLLRYFHDQGLIVADYVLPPDLRSVLPDHDDCIGAIKELVGAGWMMADPKSPGPIPRVALSAFGFSQLRQGAGQ